MRYRKTLKELDSDLQLIEEKYSKSNQGERSVDFDADNNPSVTKMDFLPSKVLKKIAKEKDVNEEEISEGMFDNIFKRSRVNNSSSKQSAREQLAKLKSGEMSIDDIVGTQQKSSIDAMYDDTENMLRDLGYEEKKETPEETIERLRKEIERRKIKRIRENIKETDLNEKKKRKKQKASDIPGYRRGRSKKQLKKLDRVTKRASAGKFTSADYEREDKRRQRELPKGAQTPKNPFTGKIAVGESKDLEEIKSLIEEVIKQELEEKKKRKKKKKKKAKRKTLSKKTMATLRKKAKSSGYTAGSLASEYRKGLGAFYTSGSRKGMGAHQWAMARVNSAIGKGNPSWANLKRSKAKK